MRNGGESTPALPATENINPLTISPYYTSRGLKGCSERLHASHTRPLPFFAIITQYIEFGIPPPPFNLPGDVVHPTSLHVTLIVLILFGKAISFSRTLGICKAFPLSRLGYILDNWTLFCSEITLRCIMYTEQSHNDGWGQIGNVDLGSVSAPRARIMEHSPGIRPDRWIRCDAMIHDIDF